MLRPRPKSWFVSCPTSASERGEEVLGVERARPARVGLVVLSGGVAARPSPGRMSTLSSIEWLNVEDNGSEGRSQAIGSAGHDTIFFFWILRPSPAVHAAFAAALVLDDVVGRGDDGAHRASPRRRPPIWWNSPR